MTNFTSVSENIYIYFREGGSQISGANPCQTGAEYRAKNREIKYQIKQDGKTVGGLVIKVDGDKGDLELLFVLPKVHSKGIGYAAWCAVEKLHPEVKVWETVTPYFEKRNIHFYVNRCGFHIVEFFNKHHPEPNETETCNDEFEEMFRFEKIMR